MATPTDAPRPPTGLRLSFDVSDLDRTCAFYEVLGGFRVSTIRRSGEIFETRELVSPDFPCLVLVVRAAFGKRAVGTSPGGVTCVGLPVKDLPSTVRRLTGKARWIGESPEASPDEPRDCVRLIDPDAYELELFRV
ncbi:MAG: VOC family protein [Phycisphaerales bacterium]|nr:VOC family protein [Phycisphaerales bacterium]